MHDDRQLLAAAAARKRGDDLADRFAHIAKGRMGADLEIGRQLQRKQEISPGRGLQPSLVGGARPPGDEALTAGPYPAGVFGQGVGNPVIAIARVTHPAKHQRQVIGDVEDGDQPERRVKPRRQIGRRKFLGQRADRRRLAREARIGRHAVAFEGDPVGPDIAEIGRGDGDAAGPRLFRRDHVIGPAIAVQHQIGDLMRLQHLADKAAPRVEMAAEMGRRQAPEQLVAEMQVDPVHAMAAGDQGAAQPVEEIGDRPLQKQEGAPLAGGGKPALCGRCVDLVTVHSPRPPDLGRIEGGDAGSRAPALAPETEAFQEVDGLPVQERLAQPERVDRPRVEPGPRQERVAPAKGPDLDAGRRLRARPAGVEAEGVGDDQRVGRRRDMQRLGQPEFGQLGRRDRPGQALLRLAVGVMRLPARPDAHPPLPQETLWRQAMRARDIDERHRVGSDVGQEQPGLDGRVKGVGVELALRVGRTFDRAAQHRLQIDHRRRRRGPGIADQVAVFRHVQQAARRRHPVEHGRIERDVAGDGIALGHLARDYGLTQISIEIAQLSEKARSRKLSLEEMQGGCFSISNLGGIGGTSFTPIVNAPEVAILGISRARMEPVYERGRGAASSDDAGQFVPRLMLPLSLSYDHRVIDGADGIRFLRWVAEALEQPFLLALSG